MASKLLEKIEAMTNCSICSQKYRIPKHLIPCLHVFCQACIEQWAKRKVRNGIFPCPLCNCNVNISLHGIEAFPGSFLATELVDNLETSTKCLVPCDIHPNVNITMCCKDCEVGICNQCLPLHPKHLLNAINIQRNEIEREITTKIKECEGKKRKLYRRREEMMVVAKEVRDQKSEIVNKLTCIVDGVIDMINDVTSNEHQKQVAEVDKELKELQDLTIQCGDNRGLEDSFPEYVSRKEVFKKLEEAVSVTVQYDTNVYDFVQVKLRDDIDVKNVFDNLFTIENVRKQVCGTKCPEPSRGHECDKLFSEPLGVASKLEETDSNSFETQKNIIAELLKTKLKKGDNLYLVDMKWFKQWKKFVGYDNWNTNLVGHARANPGPVDNSLLFDGTPNGTLRENLRDKVDYVFLPSKAWDKIVQWYGIVNQRHIISRKVIEHGKSIHLKVEVYLMELVLCEHSNPEVLKTLKFSRLESINDIEKQMRKMYNISNDKEVKLWKKYKLMDTYKHLNKPELKLQVAGIVNGQVIIIEQRNEDGSWPRQG